MTIKHLSGLAQIADHYDGFILDLWGLIHDGETPYPPARATLEALKRADKKTLLLSNAPRRAHVLVEGLDAMGIGRELYGEVLSSGEATRAALIARDDPTFARLGRKAYHLGPERDRSVFDDTHIDIVASPNLADFILVTGPREFSDQVADYQSILDAARAHGLIMVCANPDLVVIRGGRRVICAGAIAARYREMGGRALYRGKPDPAIYRLAVKQLGIADATRVAVVGDALETDVKGANAAGLESIWCTGGIHAAALGCAYGMAADPAKAEALVASFGETPTATVPGFIW